MDLQRSKATNTVRNVTISEVARMTGIPVPTIRSWERRYSFPAPPRTSGGHRRYSLAEVELLRDLRREVTNGRSARAAAEIVRARASAGEGDASRLVEAARSLDSAGVQAALQDAAERLGVEGALSHAIFPALHRVTLAWEDDGDVTIAQEHLLTEEVRRWFGCIQQVGSPDQGTVPVVLAAGVGEGRTLALEALETLLTQRGWTCRPLGSTPARAVVEAARTLGACAVVLSAESTQSRRDVLLALAALDRIEGVETFYLGSAFSAESRRRGVPGTYLGEDLGKGVEILGSAVREAQAVA